MPSTRKDPRHRERNAPASRHDELAISMPHKERGDLIDQTMAIWQERTERRLTREDGREIVENITGFFSILQEWERKERAADNLKVSNLADPNGRRHTRRNQDKGAKGVAFSGIKAEG